MRRSPQDRHCVRDEGLGASPDDDVSWYNSGDRRGTFGRNTAAVGWANPKHVQKVLAAVEEILRWVSDGADRENLIKHLRREGHSLDAHGRIRVGAAAILASIPLETLTNPISVYVHPERISESADTDPGVAISGAKALIEATTKLVLAELSVDCDERVDVLALVKAAQKALALHPKSLAPTKLGAEITKRVLSSLSHVALGIAELRNQYGPDHGRPKAVVGLRARHAHLAVGAASTYCRMLLETLALRRQSPPIRR